MAVKRRGKLVEKTATGSPARAPASSDEIRQRVSHVILLMAQGEWDKKTTADQLAEEWGVQPITVRHLAAEASRYLDLAKDDRGQLEGFIRAQLVDIAKQGGNDRVNALRTLLENKGLLRQKRELTHKHEDASDDELVTGAINELLSDPVARDQLRKRLSEEEN